MDTFSLRPTLCFGADPLAALGELAGRRVLLVTDGFLAGSGLLDRVTARLSHCAVQVFDQVEPDPSLQLVARGVAALKAFQPEVVLAFGGGSPMDCAKAMRHLAAPPGAASRPPLWCIPTTAGTGSEVTSFAVLTDTERGVKYPLVDPALIPDRAILDPSFLAGVPPAVTADTGMDVLTHAAEAYVAGGASPFTDALGEKAFSLAWASLPKAYEGQQEAKGDMLYASCLAGLAFNAAGLGACHALAHSLGGRFHLPHGRLNALLLPHVIAFNSAQPGPAAKYTRLARLCGLAPTPRSLAAALGRLRTCLGIADVLPVPRQELRAALPSLAAAALADVCLPANPRAATAQDLQAILKELTICRRH